MNNRRATGDTTSPGRMLAAALVAMAGIVVCLSIARSSSGIDYWHFWVIPRLVEQGQQDIYLSAQRDSMAGQAREIAADTESSRDDRWMSEHQRLYTGGLHPTGTPLLYATLGSLQFGHVDIDYWLFQLAGVLAVFLGSLLIGEACGARPALSLAIAGVVLLAHRGVHSDIGVANINRLQLAMFAVAMGWMVRATTGDPARPAGQGSWLRYVQWLAAGLLLGWMLMWKPNTLLSAVLPGIALLVDRHWKAALSLLAGGVAGAASGWYVGVEYLGGASWPQWRDSLQVLWREPFALESGNYALSRIAADPWVSSVSIALSLLVTGTMLVWIWKTRRCGPPDEKTSSLAPGRYATIAAAGLLVPLISAPVTWGHYLTLSVPLVILAGLSLLDQRHAVSPAAVTAVVTGIVLTALIPVTWIPGLGAAWTLVTVQSGLILLLYSGLALLAGRAANVSPDG